MLLLPKSPQICLHASQVEPGTQDYGLHWTLSKYKPGVKLVTTRRKPHLNISRFSNLQTSRFYDHHTCFFRHLVLFSTIRGNSNCSSTGDIRFVKLSSECFLGNRVITMNIQFSSHLFFSSSVIFRHIPKQ